MACPLSLHGCVLSSVKFIFERKRIAKVMTEEETLDGWIPVACTLGSCCRWYSMLVSYETQLVKVN